MLPRQRLTGWTPKGRTRWAAPYRQKSKTPAGHARPASAKLRTIVITPKAYIRMIMASRPAVTCAASAPSRRSADWKLQGKAPALSPRSIAQAVWLPRGHAVTDFKN